MLISSPLDAQVDQLLVPVAAHGDADRAAARTPQQAHRLVAAHPDGVLALDSRDDVAAANPAPIGGRALEDAVDRYAAVDDADLNPEAVVATLLPFPQAGVLPRVHVVRMRVQRLQHAPDGPRHELLDIHLVDVVGLDRRDGRRERVVLPGHRILARQHLAAEQSARDGRHDDGARLRSLEMSLLACARCYQISYCAATTSSDPCEAAALDRPVPPFL